MRAVVCDPAGQVSRDHDACLTAALRYERLGYSVVFGAAGTKYPRGRWGHAQVRRASAAELRASYQPEDVVCIVTGIVSGQIGRAHV
jgi:hypothetical protein